MAGRTYLLTTFIGELIKPHLPIVMLQTICYKSLQLLIDPALDTVEFVADNANLQSNETYIHSISLLVEYSDAHPFSYLIFNKLRSPYQLPLSLMDYTRKVVFYELRKNGVKNVLVVVPEPIYTERYRNIEQINPFMIGFTSTADAYQWVSTRQQG